MIYTLAETAKLNGLDPERYLAVVLDRLARGHTINKLAGLLPWEITLPDITSAINTNERQRCRPDDAYL